MHQRRSGAYRRTVVRMDMRPGFDPLGLTYLSWDSVRGREYGRVHLRVQLPDSQLRDLRCVGYGRERGNQKRPGRGPSSCWKVVVQPSRSQLVWHIAWVAGGYYHSDPGGVLFLRA